MIGTAAGASNQNSSETFASLLGRFPLAAISESMFRIGECFVTL